ncbi:MAG: PKD repeat protein [Sphingobacteriales bacterium]|jgi:PKD repeat protein
MKKALLLLNLSFCFLILSGPRLFAQEQEPCAADNYNDYMYSTSSEYRKSLEKISSDYQKFINTGGTEKTGHDVITIPTVFHIIHIGATHESNISDAQVLSSIEGMNIQWRNQYPDGSPFDPNGTDLKIEFCMAQRDPNGNPTGGIERIDGRSIANYETNGISSGAGGNDPQVKASSRWPNTEYYNVWVVAMIDGANPWGGGTKGYAQLGPNPAASDGTVVLFNSCGYDLDQNGNDKNTIPLFGYPDNGTMVHELGHAFSLRHTFSGQGNSPSGASCTPESNCATQGDQVCDTRQHEGDLGTCRNVGDPTCAGSTYDVYIANNFMNYCSCPSLYTPGQRDKARNMIQNSRSSLNVSDACNPVFGNDVAIKEVTKPKGLFCNTDVTPELIIKNLGAALVDSILFEYDIDGGATQTFLWKGGIVNNTEETVIFPTITGLSIAPHTFNVIVIQVNGAADDNPANNTGNTSFEIIDGEIIEVYVNGNYPAGQNWTIKKKDGTVVKSGNSLMGSYNVCLEKDCYDFEMVDNFNFAGHALEYTVKNGIGALMLEGWSTNRTNWSCCITPNVVKETNEFCLPFDPGYLTADFEADRTVIRAGTSVNFTDLSFGGDPATSWSWNFGDGQTSTDEDPSNVYATPGVFKVTLSADNIHNFASLAEKEHYIRVIEGFNNCTSYNNLISGEMGTSYDVSGETYPGVGVNMLGHAERLWINSSTNVSAIKFTPQEVTNTNPDSYIRVRIFADGGGKPGSEIASEDVFLKDLAVGQEYTVPMTNYPLVNSFYYVGYDYRIDAGENVVCGAAMLRGSLSYSNTSYVLTNTGWKSTKDHFGPNHMVSLDLTVQLSTLPQAVLNQTVFEACVGEDVSFDGSLSSNTTSINWTFENGNPATETGPNPTTQFTSDGVKNVELEVVGGCNIVLTKTTTINITPSLSANYNVVNEVCDGANGILSLDVIGGSGAYGVEWKQGPTVMSTDDEFSGVPAGTYSVTVTDGRPKCGTAAFTGIVVDNKAELEDFGFNSTQTTCGQFNGYAKALPVGGTGNYSYIWDTEPPMYSPSISNLESGTYKVTVSDGQCPPKTLSVEINNSEPVTAVITPESHTLCYGTQFFVKISEYTPTASYDWYINNTFHHSGDSLDTIATGNMNIEARFLTPDGCTLTKSSVLIVPPAPIVYANVFVDSLYMTEDSIKSNFTSAGSSATTYFWEFGDGDFSTEKNPKHFYFNPGDYWVFLRGNNGSCFTKDSVLVVVIDDRDNNGNGGPGGGVSIGDNGLLSSLAIFPNPTKDLVHLNLPKGKIVIQISDVSGKLFERIELDQKEDNALEINMVNYPAGVYFFDVQHTDSRKVEKILKMN